MQVHHAKNFCLIQLEVLDLSWYSPLAFSRLNILKSCLITASYNPQMKVVFSQQTDIVEAPYLWDYKNLKKESSFKCDVFLRDYFKVLDLINTLNLDCFFVSSYHVIGISWYLAARCKACFVAPGKFFGSYVDTAKEFSASAPEKICFWTSEGLIKASLAKSFPKDSSSLADCLTLAQEQLLSFESFANPLKLLNQGSDQEVSFSSLYQGNFPFLSFLKGREKKLPRKTIEVYLNLDGRMFPFEGLLNLLNAGFDLFFFSKNKISLKLRLAAFQSYLDSTLSSKKAAFCWKEKIFYLDSNQVASNKLVVMRKESHLLEIKQGHKTQNFCLVPNPKNGDKSSLLGELSFEGVSSPNFVEFSKFFFDSIVKPFSKEKELFFPSLVIYKLVLHELETLSGLFREPFGMLIEAFKERGFFHSFSKKNSSLINSLVSNLNLSNWLFENFLISFNKKQKLEDSSFLLFNIELALLHMKSFLVTLMILLVKKGYFPNFLASEFYLREVLFIDDKVQSFQVFIEEVGEDKFDYFVWQFFPEYLGSTSYFEFNVAEKI